MLSIKSLAWVALTAASSAAAAASGAPEITRAPVVNSTIHPHFGGDLNYLHARADAVVPGVYVCKGPGWTNGCIWQVSKTMVCMALPDSDSLAVGPDIGIQCQFYAGQNCDGDSTSGGTTAPGITDFNGYEGLNGPPGSYKCKPCSKGHEQCGAPGKKPTAWTTLNHG